ncbi:capsid [Cowpea mottle virus]|uniref:Capsid protein n=1 Tax=Cowpea mottle virus TaxID=12627 RepID=Q89761_9TOMB|nr:capsid [Cowpea mottle virus]AAC54606.1 capsid [Cowpea mottle virus]prf//2123377E capsid protein [Cowpea mottle virus]
MNGNALTITQLAKKAATQGRASLSKNQKKRLDNANTNPIKSVTRTARISTRKVPAATSTTITNGVPNYAVRQNKPVIQHVELWGTLMSNTTESPAYITRTLNPSDPATFNWVQPLSTGYDMYRLVRCEIIYTPRCAVTTTGSVVLAYDPDASDVNPDNVTDLLNMAGAESGSAYSPLSLVPNIKQIDRYIRDNSTSDPKLVDAGKILVASYGQQTSTAPFALGEIRFAYTLQLIVPQPHSTGVQRLGSAPPVGRACIRTLTSVVNTTSRLADYTLTLKTAGSYMISAVDASSHTKHKANQLWKVSSGRSYWSRATNVDIRSALKSGATITFEAATDSNAEVYVVRDSGINDTIVVPSLHVPVNPKSL